MKPHLKHIQDQVVVITGASSGIGLTTARMAAHQGAKVVLAARDQKTLERLRDEIKEAGGTALAIATDVRRLEDVRRLAAATVHEFGSIDTWVNNAGGSIYGRILEVPVEEERQLFETNFWGVVYGSRVAAEHFRTHSGAIINVGSVASDRAVPLQAAYSASKHAVKAYTDALRSELEKEGAAVSVTLIKPTGIDTPFFRHSKNHMSAEPLEPSPLYAPETVARAILYAAQHPTRDILVGGTAPLLSVMGRIMPRLGDKFATSAFFTGQKSKRSPAPEEHQFLEHATGDLKERGYYPDVTVLQRSLYTEAKMRPVLKGLLATSTMLGLAVSMAFSRRNSSSYHIPLSNRAHAKRYSESHLLFNNIRRLLRD